MQENWLNGAFTQQQRTPGFTPKLRAAIRLMSLSAPHLAGLARHARVQESDKVQALGIFASGRVLIRPSFWAELPDVEAAFVLAHALMHFILRSHLRSERESRRVFNIAHDIKINWYLSQLFGFEAPAQGIICDDWRAENYSTEQLSREISLGNIEHPETIAFGGQTADELLDDETERKWFPNETRRGLSECARQISRCSGKANALGVIQSRGLFKGTEAGDSQMMVASLRQRFAPPWEMALQRWLESVSPGPRTYARPSRRMGERTDVVLPGRARESWILNVILDTSGSMTEELSAALGLIVSFCEGVGVDIIRVLQCDTDVHIDEEIDPSQLISYAINGYGGSNMSPAMERLAEDPNVKAAIVITDGYIDFPQEEVPYQVLWALTPSRDMSFSPGYGVTVAIDLRSTPAG